MAEQATAAEPTQTPEGGAPETEVKEVETEVRPEYLDPRFKTVEDQAKAYKEAEKWGQQNSQRAADLERQNRELLARQQAVQVPSAPEPNYNELFWQNPVEVIEKVLERKLQPAVAPFIEDRWQTQKDRYANDADFKRYEPQIDALVAAQPELKKQPGAVDKLYKVVRAMEFDPDAERKRIEMEVRQSMNNKTAGMVEGAGSPPEVRTTPKMELSANEQVVARKFYDQLPPQEAYKRYAEAKKKMGGE